MAAPPLPRVLFALGFVAAALGVGAVARAKYLPEDGFFAGIRVDGERVDTRAELRAVAEKHAEALRARKVRVMLGDKRVLVAATLGELGLEVDVDRAVALAEGLGQDADALTKAELGRRAARGEIDVPPPRHVNANVVVAKVEPLKDGVDRAPVSARLDLDHHSVLAEKDGEYIDLDALASALDDAASSPAYANDGDLTVAMPVAVYKPRVSSAFLEKIAIGEVVGSFETGFSRQGDQASRARNVEVAASRINGFVMQPGDVMSFNAVVGARSLENGFRKAHEIFKGEFVEGIGGGTCQVASTFHAAAFFGGLDVLERAPHSRPSAYIPLGLDSTVVYPSVDLKIRNPYDFPIVIHAWVEGNKLKVELLGQRHPVKVSYDRDVLGTFPFTRKVVEEDWVTKPSIKQKGIKGIEIRRSRVLAYADGHKKVETSTEMYQPTMEIYRVPPGFDQNELPPLGEDPNAPPADENGEKKPEAAQPTQQG